MPDPLLPIIDVTIRNPVEAARTVRLKGLIDTGSDTSAIPHVIARQLGLRSRRRIQVTGIDELRVMHKTYLPSLEFAGAILERRRVIEWAGDFVIIGRDLLSEFTFTYDGKNRRFEIKDP